MPGRIVDVGIGVPFWESWAQPATRIARKIPNEMNNIADIRILITLAIFCFRDLLSDLILTVRSSSVRFFTNGSYGSPLSMHAKPDCIYHGAGGSFPITQTDICASDHATNRISGFVSHLVSKEDFSLVQDFRERRIPKI